MQHVLEVPRGGGVIIGLERYAGRHDHTRQCCVDTRFQHSQPDDRTHDHVGRNSFHAKAVQGDERRDAAERHETRVHAEVIGVEDSNDDDGHQVVDHGHSGQEDLQ